MSQIIISVLTHLLSKGAELACFGPIGRGLVRLAQKLFNRVRMNPLLTRPGIRLALIRLVILAMSTASFLMVQRQLQDPRAELGTLLRTAKLKQDVRVAESQDRKKARGQTITSAQADPKAAVIRGSNGARPHERDEPAAKETIQHVANGADFALKLPSVSEKREASSQPAMLPRADSAAAAETHSKETRPNELQKIITKETAANPPRQTDARPIGGIVLNDGCYTAKIDKATSLIKVISDRTMALLDAEPVGYNAVNLTAMPQLASYAIDGTTITIWYQENNNGSIHSAVAHGTLKPDGSAISFHTQELEGVKRPINAVFIFEKVPTVEYQPAPVQTYTITTAMPQVVNISRPGLLGFPLRRR